MYAVDWRRAAAAGGAGAYCVATRTACDYCALGCELTGSLITCVQNLYVSRDDPVPAAAASSDGEDVQSAPPDLGLCVVCQASAVERALLPCRHACVCNGCFAVLLNCPLCRTFITSSFGVTPSSSALGPDSAT